MAIDTGLAIACADLQATGGITQILLRSWGATDVIAYGATGTHSIASILEVAADANWFVYEFKNETPALTINGTKEIPGKLSRHLFAFTAQKAILSLLRSNSCPPKPLTESTQNNLLYFFARAPIFLSGTNTPVVVSWCTT